jgi:hypothetical protein
MAKDKRLEFESYEEAAEWFESCDLADYQDHMSPVEFSFDLRKNQDMVVLDREIAKAVRSLARKEKIPTRRLVNRMLKKGLEGME